MSANTGGGNDGGGTAPVVPAAAVVNYNLDDDDNNKAKMGNKLTLPKWNGRPNDFFDQFIGSR